MAPKRKNVPAPPGYSWSVFLKTYRQRNGANYKKTRHGNTRLMRSAGKAWALFKEQAAAAFTKVHYGDSEEEDMDQEENEKK